MLYVYVSDANIAAIVVQLGHKYRLVRWDMTTDNFVRGQWLLNGRLRHTISAISSDGMYFKYKLLRWDIQQWPTIYVVTSILPYFSAINIQRITDYGKLIGQPIDTVWKGLVSFPFQNYEIQEDALLKDGQVIFDASQDTFEAILLRTTVFGSIKAIRSRTHLFLLLRPARKQQIWGYKQVRAAEHITYVTGRKFMCAKAPKNEK